mgnify:FL=1
MTDSALDSLYPTHNIGSSFNWFIGQIESDKKDDPKGSGRYRVRIVGHHPETCDIVSSETLGWAQTMMPVTNPHTPGGATSVSDQLESGTWVVGFFLDTDKQQPMIIGSIGRVANSFDEGESEDQDPTPGESTCKSFTTFVKPKNKQAFDQFEKSIELDSTAAGHAADGVERKTDDGENISESETIYLKNKYAANSETNPAGINWCIEIADTCGKETNMEKTFGRLFQEMLYETQRNNGKLGTYLVGEISGDLTDAVGVGRKYVTKATQLIRTFVASVKGFVIEKMREATKALTDALLYPDDVKGNSLSKVTKFFNKYLKKIGCEMADLGDRLAGFIEDIIFGYLFNIYKQTACQVDKFVNGILNKIQSLMNDLLNSVLGPIQDLLGAIAAPFNILGDAINYVLNILGITCSGPDKKCNKKTVVCTDCRAEDRDDFLDDLLESLDDAPKDWNQYACADSFTGRTIPKTSVSFVGGIQDVPAGDFIAYSINDIFVKEGEIAEFTVRRAGNTDIVSSVGFSTRDGTALKDSDYEETDGVLGFVRGETEKTISVRTFSDTEVEKREDFFVVINKDTPGNITAVTDKNIGRCVIRAQNTPPDPTQDGQFDAFPESNPTGSSVNPANPNIFPDTVEPDAENGSENDPDDSFTDELARTYSVVADRESVKEGEFITYTITTENVPNGTVLSYRLFGTDITPSDIVNFSLGGSFTISENSATVVVGINDDEDDREFDETLIFAINGTGATASVLILSDTASFTPLEKLQAEDGSTVVPPDRKPILPTVGTIITGPGGEIIHVPVENPGDRYTEAPAVFITGAGIGTAAIGLLDDNGFLSEIRITDPGFGFKLNEPTVAEKECIIDSFTMIRPGREYTSAPTVYVNGDDTIAEAVVENGQVISVRIKNREITFDSYPTVLILGGGGYGATFLPSFSCLEPEARVKVGSAKIGTGSYIDCP